MSNQQGKEAVKMGRSLIASTSLEQNLEPKSESTKLEGAEGFVEYKAAGKLEGNKALITGGESVSNRSIPSPSMSKVD